MSVFASYLILSYPAARVNGARRLYIAARGDNLLTNPRKSGMLSTATSLAHPAADALRGMRRLCGRGTQPKSSNMLLWWNRQTQGT